MLQAENTPEFFFFNEDQEESEVAEEFIDYERMYGKDGELAQPKKQMARKSYL